MTDTQICRTCSVPIRSLGVGTAGDVWVAVSGRGGAYCTDSPTSVRHRPAVRFERCAPTKSAGVSEVEDLVARYSDRVAALPVPVRGRVQVDAMVRELLDLDPVLELAREDPLVEEALGAAESALRVLSARVAASGT